MKNDFRFRLSLDNVDSYEITGADRSAEIVDEATNTMYLEFQTWT